MNDDSHSSYNDFSSSPSDSVRGMLFRRKLDSGASWNLFSEMTDAVDFLLAELTTAYYTTKEEMEHLNSEWVEEDYLYKNWEGGTQWHRSGPKSSSKLSSLVRPPVGRSNLKFCLAGGVFDFCCKKRGQKP